MISLAADENFNNRVVRGLVRCNRLLDIVRIQDAGLIGADDRTVLQWAADNRRIIVTHDVSTMVRHAQRRVKAGLTMSGLFACSRDVPIGVAISDLLLLA